MTKQLEKVLQAIDGLNNDEINQVAERCNLRRTYLNKLNIRQFRIGDKVKFTIKFKGRELQHVKLGNELMDKIKVETLQILLDKE